MTTQPSQLRLISCVSRVLATLVIFAVRARAQTEPTITQEPVGQTNAIGANATLSVAVAGTGPFSYRWLVNGTNLPNGVISLAAGRPGLSGYSGDGGPAVDALFSVVNGLALDSSGNLFVADSLNNLIREAIPAGIITSVAGNGSRQGYSGDGGAATNAGLFYPAGVAVDAAGELFIADARNSRVRKVDVHGVITTVAGNGSAGYSGDGGAATNAALNPVEDYPFGVAVDAPGNLFIADAGNNRIRKVDLAGVITTVAGNGVPGYSGDGGAATNASLQAPLGVAVDISGNLIIADYSNNRVRKVAGDGVITTAAGNGAAGFSGDGGSATNASLSSPFSVAVDSAGEIYIADFNNNRIRKVGLDAAITTVAGGGANRSFVGGAEATNANLDTPMAVAIDGAGNLFIGSQDASVLKVALENSPTLTLDNISAANDGDYQVVVTSPYGSVTSSVAVLASLAATPPSIVTQPQNLAVVAGGSAALSVSASGLPPLTYQWLFGVSAIDGGTNAILSLTNTQYSQAGDYSVVVSNPGGSVTSSVAVLTVAARPPNGTNVFDLFGDFSGTRNPNGPWTYGGQDYNGVFHAFTNTDGAAWRLPPSAESIGLGQGVGAGMIACVPQEGDPRNPSLLANLDEQFTIPPGADGYYQLTVSIYNPWDGIYVLARKNGQDVLASPPDFFWPTNISAFVALAAGDVVEFFQITSAPPNPSPLYFEAVLSEPAANTSIFTQPASGTFTAGDSAEFGVGAGGFPPLTYQWMIGTNSIAGATNAILNLPDVQAAQAGVYSVVVTGPAGSVTSSNAVLTVSAPALPGITSQPASQSVAVGSSATLTVGAAGSLPLSYQWYVGPSGDISSPVPGATNAVFVTGALYSNAAFWAEVRNAFGTANSTAALVTVGPANSLRLGITVAAGVPALTVFGNAGLFYRVEFSGDLGRTNWTPLLETNLISSSYTFTDSSATNSARFYRARSLP